MSWPDEDELAAWNARHRPREPVPGDPGRMPCPECGATTVCARCLARIERVARWVFARPGNQLDLPGNTPAVDCAAAPD